MIAMVEPFTPWLRDAHRFIDSERGFGRFEQTLRVSRELDPNAIEASTRNCVLTFHLPKPESLKPRRIAIRTGQVVEGSAAA